jgi:hypothetical protein
MTQLLIYVFGLPAGLLVRVLRTMKRKDALFPEDEVSRQYSWRLPVEVSRRSCSRSLFMD